MPTKPKDAIARQIEAAASEDVPHLYFNGLSTSLGAGDVVCALFNQGGTVGTLNMSFTMAKTMANQLNAAIKALEEKTGHEIMTIEFIVDKLKDEETGEESQ